MTRLRRSSGGFTHHLFVAGFWLRNLHLISASECSSMFNPFNEPDLLSRQHALSVGVVLRIFFSDFIHCWRADFRPVPPCNFPTMCEHSFILVHLKGWSPEENLFSAFTPAPSWLLQGQQWIADQVIHGTAIAGGSKGDPDSWLP